MFKPALLRPLLRHSLLVAALLAAGAAQAAGPSTQFQVSGAVASPTTYDYGSLAAKAPTTQTVTFGAGSGSETHVYTGTSLWGVLNDSGILVSGAKNDILNKYVLATGSDGYKTVFSLGELNPSFGNRPDLLAYNETLNNVSAPLTGNGFARVTVQGDVKGGRYVSNLVDLDVRSSGSTQGATTSAPTTQFSVSGGVVNPTTFDLASLEAALPSQTEIVGGHSYKGVSFWDLLNSVVGIVVDPTVKNDVLGKYVVATGSDGYKSLFSMGELDTAFGNQPDLVAFAEDGAPIADDGFARIVVPNDVKAGRWVSNLVSLEVFSAAAVPEPQTYALMLMGLLAVAAIARRRGSAVL
jgi:DMSO/TMAO reductase YedYZ molybdopterin-dependent catalytic subunit